MSDTRTSLLLCWMAAAAFACSDTEAKGPGDTAPDESADRDGDLESDADVALDVVDDLDADELGEVIDLVDVADNPFPVIERTEPPAGQDPAGHPDVLEALGAGEVRAGRVGEAGAGFGGVRADCRPGDYKLYNAVVQFCVAGLVPTTLYNYTGGQLVDADRVGADNDHFLLDGVHNQFNVAGGTTVEVANDGADGLAVVRVRGPEEPIRIIAEIIGLTLPFRGVSFETEYRLRPDVPYLELVTWVRSEDGTTVLRAGDIPLFGDSMRLFVPGFGRIMPAGATPIELAAATAPGRSYALYSSEGLETLGLDLSALGSAYDIFPLVAAIGRLSQGQEGAYRRYFIVGEGDTASLRAQIAALEGREEPGARLRVSASEAGEPVVGELFVVYDGEGLARDVLVTDTLGEASIPLPPGDYAVGPEDWVGGFVTPVEVSLGATDETVAFVLPKAAVLDLTVEAFEGDADPAASPAKIMLFGPRDERLFAVRGEHHGRHRPGTYRIEISRGEEYSATVLEAVELEQGANAPLAATLERVWQTDGLVAGEFHQHMTNSPDSDVSQVDRLLSNICEGVDFVVPSDHEYVSDYGPTIAELEAADLIHFMPSTEVSPLSGHLNPMPMTIDPTRPGNGAYAKSRFDPVERTLDIFQFPRIVADLRANYGVRVIQLNHPRDGFGQFDTAAYDPVGGPATAISAHFTTDFDSLEVFNSARVFCQVFDDWVSLVARGHHITAVGNSDTHSLGTESGYPRNYLPSAASSPGEVTDEEILAALESGNVSVSGGALITFPDGPAMGALVDVSEGDTFDLPLHVQTPVWSSIDELVVLVGGREVERLSVDEADDVVVVLDEVLTLDAPQSDDYLIVVAWGNTRMPIVTPGERPFGLTNPIYLDVDGDGEWTPPGIQSVDDLPGLDIPWCQ